VAPTSDPSGGELHANAAQGWSIRLPTGWDVVAESDSGTALTRSEAIAEILVAPSTGLTFEELAAQKLDELSTWAGAADITSELVRLPAADALRVTMATEVATDSPGMFVMYVLEEGDTQYVISVRGPQDTDDLLADVEFLAESFAILD
jgi:hypothetical protein